ncbi:MAG: ketosteroid isomerase-related protein [Pseudomonadota bacterium]
MGAAATRKLIKSYYEAFNQQDTAGMLDCLASSFVHEVNQGERRRGKRKFAEFLQHMNSRYVEKLGNIVIMSSPDGTRAAAEFDLKGKYVATDEGLPPAVGQTYKLRVGAFFEIREGKISRVSTHYNLAEWTRQVVG